MLHITATQWQALARASFAERLVGVLRESHPGHPVDARALGPGIVRQVDRAAAHGLLDERSAARFTYAAWLLGEGFDERIPAVAQVLAARHVSTETRSRFLVDFVQASCAAAAGHGGGAR
jgi:hypothetical protein